MAARSKKSGNTDVDLSGGSDVLNSSQLTKSENGEKLSRDFYAHLNKIKRAKNNADKVVGRAFPDAAQASLSIAWELVFDHLCGVSDLTLSELNTLSGVIHKLSSSKIQLDFDDENSSTEKKVAGEINEESIREIEKKLKLL